jgi:hypothetical protein
LAAVWCWEEVSSWTAQTRTGLPAGRTVGFTPHDWLSLSIGPAAGYEALTAGTIDIFGPPSPSYYGPYVGGEARIDFFPGVGPSTWLPRTRRSFDFGIVALVGAPTGGAPQQDTLLVWSLYLELGYVQF